MSIKIRSRIARTTIFILLFIIAVMDLYPLFYMGMGSLKTTAEFIQDSASLPKTLYLDNYKALYYRFDVVMLFVRTLLSIAAAWIWSMALSIPASYAFAKIRFRHKNAFFLLMIATMAIPGITFIIPNYLFMSRLGLIDHLLSVIIMWSVTSLPGTVFLLTSLMRGLPNEMLESLKIDGGNYLQLMSKVVIPLSVPGIMTVSIFNLTGWWNDLLTPLLYLQSDNLKTVTVAAATILGRYDSDYPLLLAGLVMTAIPPIVIYICLQGYIRKGLIIGAIKA